MSETTPDHAVRGVLSLPDFRKLWVSLGISSFGDWLGLLATTAMAAELGGLESYARANLAVSAVLVLRLLPAMLFGPVAGVVADRFDRKLTMVAGDILRGALFISIPVVGTLPWLFVATVLIEIVGLFWMPAKDATVPNLVPKNRLEVATQLSLATTYGSAPVAALAFSLLALVHGVVDPFTSFLRNTNDLALYLDAATYFYAAFVVSRLNIPRRASAPTAGTGQPGFFSVMIEGWRFVGQTPLMRGLILGMLGAFGAGGFVIGLAPTFTRDLDAGPAGYGILFGSVFTGLALGMWLGPRVLAQLSRWRLFALSIVTAGAALGLLAVVQQIVLATYFALLVGIAAGMAWVTGYTMLGVEVADDLRGRTFAFVQSAARVVLVAVMAAAPGLAALLGTRNWRLTEHVAVSVNGTALTLLFAAILAVVIGVASYRIMDDHGELTLGAEFAAVFGQRARDNWWISKRDHDGFLLVLEGVDGAGKSTQVAAVAEALRAEGRTVRVTREPGATGLGTQIRAMLLDGSSVANRTEALLFAADRAQHVNEVIRPALARGHIVITDRFVDSSTAYQAGGRGLSRPEVQSLSTFATGGLVADMTVVLDLDPATSRQRRHDAGGPQDRIETEADSFHRQVREAFLTQARRNPHRYVVLDAGADPDRITGQILDRIRPLLPGLAAQPGPGQGADATAGMTGGTPRFAPDASQPDSPAATDAAEPAAGCDPAPSNRRDCGAPQGRHRSRGPADRSALPELPAEPPGTDDTAGTDEWSRPWQGR
ncbi:MAG: dTMP kinase [Micrococcales bacterium]|nr:MAG: dTMP kinase [Micrococcales bacterium]PIE27356.1 MAG: dTMP kinase [Micrococcales bacterium]